MLSWNEAATIAIKKLVDAGYEGYIVGGAVRDMVMKRPIRDIDISTNATVEEMEQIFSRTIDVGVAHGTIIVPIGGRAIEITQYRTKDNEVSLHNDLSLRDFTCNAMAMDLSGKIIDPFGGIAAIENQVLQVVGGSPNPFLDDPLRLLRAIRFSILLQFSIEKETHRWMTEYASLILKPSIERVTAELSKLVEIGLEKKDLDTLLSHRVIKQLPYILSDPSLLESRSFLWNDSVLIKGMLEGWSFLTYSQELSLTRRGLTHYRLSNQVKKSVITVVECVEKIRLQNGWTNYDLYMLGEEGIQAAEKLLSVLEKRQPDIVSLKNRYFKLPITSKSQLAITGRELIDWFPHQPRPWVGETLGKVERVVVSGKVRNSKKDIYKWLMEENR
ncbi:MAG: CCA tRNA nucleotidyltransferase [Bacillus sp. (in: Bacteria)]|nr:CCA tRNA nucleotidyltransferase [Bacillus sp. (in: firmicutes)]